MSLGKSTSELLSAKKRLRLVAKDIKCVQHSPRQVGSRDIEAFQIYFYTEQY